MNCINRWCAAWAFLLVSGMALAPVRADVEAGVRLLRSARQSLDQGDSQAALALLDQAYIELPFAAEGDLVHHERADAYAAEGRYVEALDAYAKALHGPAAHRARFNSGVLQDRMAEEALSSAGVPLDPAAIPADADPGPLIDAIEQNMPLLESARRQFMEALRLSPDAEARESVEALNRRLADLAEMLEELKRRQEQQDKQDKDKQDKGDDQNDDQNKDDQNQDQQKQDDQSQDQQNQQKQEQNGEQSPDSQQQDQQQGEDQQPPPEQDPEQQQARKQPAAQPAKELTPAQLADLLDQLEALEQKAMEMDRQRRAAAQAEVEKDW